MTLLVVSVFAKTVEEAAARSAAAWKQGAEAVELRIDHFRGDPADLAAFLRRQHQRTWIVTCRSAAEGGNSTDDVGVRIRRLAEAVRGTGALVDFESFDWRDRPEIRKAIESTIDKDKTRPHLILSAHEFSGASQDVRSLVEEALSAEPGVVAKVAYAGAHIGDSFAALDVMHETGPRAIAICMGEDGSWTRVMAKKLGAFAGYAALSSDTTTAPGQWTIDELCSIFRWPEIDPETKVYGLIGDPVAHSAGPLLFNHWFAECGINAVYLPLRLRADSGGIARFLDECGKRPWLDIGGFSVTIPHKSAALAWAKDSADPISQRIGAANTICFGAGGNAAYNTDCYAAIASLTDALGCDRADLAGLSVDVLGAGGAASAVLYGLHEFGCRATVYARSADSGKILAKRFGCEARAWGDRARRSGDVIINCTPIGMWPNVDATPLRADGFRGCRLVFDLIYRPLQTTLLADAAAAGCQTLNGLDMFVRQAATQFGLWTGTSPDGASARDFLRCKLERAAPHVRASAPGVRCVALVGFRGSGKTTVGRALAVFLGGDFIDTDDLIVKAAGRTIADIFAGEGEAGFRKREAEVIRCVVATPPAVLSVGGGAVLDERNVEALRSVATIVWLTAPANVLRERIEADPLTAALRPHLTTGSSIEGVEHLLENREPHYRGAAELIVDTTNAAPEQIAREIALRLGLV
jgi:3-dehydroquinate dehydratase/shikimate dehydrogenase